MALQASSASSRVLADNPHGASVLMDRPPRRHEAGASVKAGTAAALITDHERKAVSIRAPYFHVLDATDDADELHGRSIHGAPPIREAPRPERKANPESWRRCGASPKGDGFLSKSGGLLPKGLTPSDSLLNQTHARVIGAESDVSSARGYAQRLVAQWCPRTPVNSALALGSPRRLARTLLLPALQRLDADRYSPVSPCRDLSYRARSAAIADRLRLGVTG
jgi:hypothetical protein